MKEIEKDLASIKKEYSIFSKQKDDQSLFYLNQMIDLLEGELKAETGDKESLNQMINKDFKNSITLIYSNMTDYFAKVLNKSTSNMDQIITLSISNKYIDSLSKIYRSFKEEINNSLKIKEKIDALVDANGTTLTQGVLAVSPENNKHKINEILSRYMAFICGELTKNVTSKSEFILKEYKKIIDKMELSVFDESKKIEKMNIEVINGVVSLYLKEQEYFVINKFAKENYVYINNAFNNLEDKLYQDFGIKRNNTSLNKTKDYLLSFNNTITIKIKDIFNQMNNVVYLESTETSEKLKEFSDAISHVYEKELIFDKQFQKYKKEFNVSSRHRDNFNKVFKEETSNITNSIKMSISNVFRNNIKVYNDVIYKSLLLKSKVSEYNIVLSNDKVKDLLFK